MNYPESTQIIKEIKEANKILLNCHRSPDPDSIGSTLAMRLFLLGLGKEVIIVCPSDDLFPNVGYLSGYDEIKKGVDFNSFNFSEFDLFISLDSSSTGQITNIKDFEIKGVKTVVIDHHLTNDRFGELNLVDDKVGSVGEMVYLLFEDWGVHVSKDMADCMITAIVADTGAFRFPGANERTFLVASKLMQLGADKDYAIHKIFRSEPFELIKFYGEVLTRAELDSENKFVWAAVPYDVYKRLGKPSMAKESAASLFAQVVEGTDFGFIALEQEPGKLHVSLRSRSGFNTSKIATELGGGGHVYASGARVEGKFEEAVEKVLSTCRKYATANN